jgi:hypothetical protein
MRRSASSPRSRRATAWERDSSRSPSTIISVVISHILHADRVNTR